MQNALLSLLVVSTVLCIVLSALTVGRKLWRDRHEQSIAARRAEFRELLCRGSPTALTRAFREVRRARQPQFDLLGALNAEAAHLDERWPVVQGAAARARLDRALTKQLRARDPVRRGAAALLVGRLHLPDASHLIAPLLRDGDGDVRLAAAHALGVLATDDAAHALIRALATRRLEPERVIERLGAEWAVPAMLAVLDVVDSGRPVDAADAMLAPTPAFGRPFRAPLARALGLAGDPRAEHQLLAIFRLGDLEERVAAARALGPAGTAVSIPELEAALEDAEWQVRAQAARSLGIRSSPSVVPALARHLSDPAWWVRAAAADALVELGEPGLAALRAALVDSDRYARDRAREALEMHDVRTVGR